MNLGSNDNTSTCRRCGTCCEQGGPALHAEDLEIVNSGAISMRDLITIRPGEPVYDQQQGRVLPAESEFVKLAGRQSSWSCKFYEKLQGCGIYGRRPLECRLLFCRDTGPLEAVMGRDLLVRRDLLDGDDQVWPWLERLEREVSYYEVSDLLAGFDRQNSYSKNLDRLTGLVRSDLAIRQTLLRDFSDRASNELFLLGRPLFLVISPYGFRVVEGRDGVRLNFTGLGS